MLLIYKFIEYPSALSCASLIYRVGYREQATTYKQLPSSLVEVTSPVSGLFLYQIVAALGLLDACAGWDTFSRSTFTTYSSTCANGEQPTGSSIPAIVCNTCGLGFVLPMLSELGDHFLHLGEIVYPKHVFFPYPLLLHTLICTVSIHQILQRLVLVLTLSTNLRFSSLGLGSSWAAASINVRRCPANSISLWGRSSAAHARGVCR